ncbi:MAG: efflux RND transporter periplasmic adaptor subunit [Alphaproteobacteria bacterium]|nr:efflux RND transporter periplasmic adaptor subunit [Alphaproteobacteria bacterium]
MSFDATPTKSSSKTPIWIKIVLFLVVIALLGGTGFMLVMKIKFADFAIPQTPANVVVTKIVPVLFEETIDAIGTAQSNESADITSTVTETIKSINVTEGQFVETGTVLVELSDEEELATLNEATRSYMRYNALTKKNLGSAADRDVSLAKMEVAKAQLNERRITAPFNGVIGIREVSIGDLVTPGTIITTIDDVDPIKLDFSVPESYISSLSNGMKIKARTEAYPDKIFEGEIYTIDSRVDPDTRSIRVRAIVANLNGELRPGLLMKVLIIRRAFEALAVPEEAIQSAGDRMSVYVVDAEGQVSSKAVVTGLREPGYVEIISGLTQGDSVIIEGQMKTGDGASVKIVEERTIEQAQSAALDYSIKRKKDAITDQTDAKETAE